MIAPAGSPPTATGPDCGTRPVRPLSNLRGARRRLFRPGGCRGGRHHDRRNFYDVNDRWLESGWPARADAPAARLARQRSARRGPGSRPTRRCRSWLPALPTQAPSRREQQSGENYRAECDVLRPAYALFKMTWHPNWQAYVDGRPQPSVMLSPGFSGVAVSPGHHTVEFRYEPGPLKPVLAIAGLLLVRALRTLGRALALRSQRRSRNAFPCRGASTWAREFSALSLPVMVPLFSSGVLAGHDSFEYFPRVVEMQQNLANGILLPRWAPDLGHGYGQPLFIFRPPFFYWIAEAWRLLGWDVVTAVNLACALLVRRGGGRDVPARPPVFRRDGRMAGGCRVSLCAVLRGRSVCAVGARGVRGVSALSAGSVWFRRVREERSPALLDFGSVRLCGGAVLPFPRGLVVYARAALFSGGDGVVGEVVADARGTGRRAGARGRPGRMVLAAGDRGEAIRRDGTRTGGQLSVRAPLRLPASAIRPGMGLRMSLPGPNDGMSFSLGGAMCCWRSRRVSGWRGNRNTPIACRCVSSPRRAWLFAR